MIMLPGFMRMPLDTLWKTFQIGAHMLDQPAVIKRVERAMPALYAAGSLTLLGSDLYTAKTPAERKKIGIRDTIVLASTIVGTLLGAVIMKHPPHIHPASGMTPVLKELATRYDSKLIQLLANKGADHLNYAELKSVVKGMWAATKDRLKGSKDRESLLEGFWSDLRQKALPVHEDNETLRKKALHAIHIFLGGAVSVAGGVVGGLLATKAVGGSKEHKANIFKEAVFQFVANIALCAVGALLGLVAIEKLNVKNTLAKSTLLFTGMGLGIFGGGSAANWVGPKTVNPLLDWWGQPKHKHTWENLKHRFHHAWKNGGDARKVEFADMILHLDDIPTIFAIAGMKIFEPLIQLFFAFSAYRSGVGYRNEETGHHRHHGAKKHAPIEPASLALKAEPQPQALLPKAGPLPVNPLMLSGLPVHNRFMMAPG